MTRPSLEEIEETLRRPTPPPPAGLLKKIYEEIPAADLAVADSTSGGHPQRRWLIAASLIMAVGATVLVLRTERSVDLRPATSRVEAESSKPPQVPSSVDFGEIRFPDEPPTPESAPAVGSERALPRPTKSAPVEEPLTVSSESLLLDERRKIPTSRDPWAILNQASGVMVDRINGGGNVSGQKSVFRGQSLNEPQGQIAAPSTGGTTEPNDAPWGDMFFRDYGVNPSVDTEDDRFSTFGLDVDTGSYTLVRSYLERGQLPPREAIRVEEMVNFFDYGDPAPQRGDFAVHAQVGPDPFADGPRYRLLRFNLHAREVDPEDRKPATLVFVVDVSGSMNRENRLGLVKRSLFLLLDQLRADDRVGLVVYGSRGQVLLEPTGDLAAIRGAIDRLVAGGSTNAEEGLVLGYDLAGRHLREGAIHRVILCSDGVANVGRTGPGSILERIGRESERGIELTTVGFGMGNYNDRLMEQLADRGDGSYSYVDDLDEAKRIFVQNLTGTLQTIASDVKVQVEFNPKVVSRYRLFGYENRDIADERFRDDTVDAGEIGAGHAVAALYEIKLRTGSGRRAVLATLRLRYRSKATGEVVETAREVRLRDAAKSWDEASRELRLTAVVAELAENLKGSYWARGGDLDDLFVRAQHLSAEFAGDVEVAELVTLIGKAARLSTEK
jgi:Ca-activated chloride channel homolog